MVDAFHVDFTAIYVIGQSIVKQMFVFHILNWVAFHRHLLSIILQKSVSPIIGQHRLKLQLIGKKLAIGNSFFFALRFELRHLFYSLIIL